jgi:hypothetical protein
MTNDTTTSILGVCDSFDKESNKKEMEGVAAEKARLAAWKANDMDAYSRLLDKTKNKRLKFLMDQTEKTLLSNFYKSSGDEKQRWQCCIDWWYCIILRFSAFEAGRGQAAQYSCWRRSEGISNVGSTVAFLFIQQQIEWDFGR